MEKRPLKHKYKKTTGWMRKELVLFCGVQLGELPTQDAKLQRALEKKGYSFGEESKTSEVNR